MRLYESDLPRVRLGARVWVKLPGETRQREVGVLSFVSSVVDEHTRTVEARLRLANYEEALRPGLSAMAWIEEAAAEEGLWLPRGAVQVHDGARVVFVETETNRFEARRVEVGEEGGDGSGVERSCRKGRDS